MVSHQCDNEIIITSIEDKNWYISIVWVTSYVVISAALNAQCFWRLLSIMGTCDLRKPVKHAKNPRPIDVKFRTFDNVDENTKYAKMVRIGMLV